MKSQTIEQLEISLIYYKLKKEIDSGKKFDQIEQNDQFLPQIQRRFRQIAVFTHQKYVAQQHQKSREFIKISNLCCSHLNSTFNRTKINLMALSGKKHAPIYVNLEQQSEKADQPDQRISSDDEIQVQTESYNLRIDYVHIKKQITITVLQKESQDAYAIIFSQQELPLQLAFYQTIQTVYLALKNSQSLIYSIQQKYFQLQDLINNKPKKIRITLTKSQTSRQSNKLKNMPNKQQQLKQTQSELKLLQVKYDQTQKNISILNTMLKQSQQETVQKQKELQLQKLKVESLQEDIELLKNECYSYKRHFSDSIKEFEFYSKRRKDAERIYCEVSARNSQVGLSSSNIERHIEELDLTFQSLDSMDSNIVEIDETQFKHALSN